MHSFGHIKISEVISINKVILYPIIGVFPLFGVVWYKKDMRIPSASRESEV